MPALKMLSVLCKEICGYISLVDGHHFFSMLSLCSSFVIILVNFVYCQLKSTFQVQLTVTPRVEGILKVVGVRWKLSNSVGGYHNFESNLVKKITKGRRKAKNSPSDNLKFMVIKVHPLPPCPLLLIPAFEV